MAPFKSLLKTQFLQNILLIISVINVSEGFSFSYYIVLEFIYILLYLVKLLIIDFLFFSSNIPQGITKAEQIFRRVSGCKSMAEAEELMAHGHK